MLTVTILNWLLSIAYYSLQPQAALAIIYLTASDRPRRVRELLLLVGVTLGNVISDLSDLADPGPVR